MPQDAVVEEALNSGSVLSDLEQVVERLTRGCRPLRPGLPLDRGPWRKERAVVPRIFRRHPRGERILRALESRTRVELRALDAGVQIDAAAGTAAVALDRQRQPVTAAGAAEDLVRRHQVRRPRAGGILQRPAGRPLFRRRFLARPLAPRLARLVLVAALSVLPVAHPTCPA